MGEQLLRVHLALDADDDVGWYVFEVTGSAFLVTLVGFSGMGPLVVLGVFGGVLADRLDKRKLLLATLLANLLAATGMAALIFSDLIFSASNVQFWHAYVVMLVGGIGWGLDMPSRRTIVLDVLGRARVNNAIALDSVGMHSSRMLGPLIGGGLISISLFAFSDGHGLEAGYAVTLVFFIMSAVMMLNVKTPPRDATTTQASWNILRNLVEGIRYVYSESTLLAVVLITVFIEPAALPVPTAYSGCCFRGAACGADADGIAAGFGRAGGVDGFNSDSLGV